MFFQKKEPRNKFFGQKGALRYLIFIGKKKSKCSLK